MIQITKGNPTPEEIAALVAVLALAGATTQPGPLGSTAAGWRRSAPPAQLNPACTKPGATGAGDLGPPGGLALARRTPRYPTGSTGPKPATSS